MVQGSFHIRKSLQRHLRYKIFVFFSNVLNIVFYAWTNSITRTIFLNCAIKRDVLQASPSLFPKGYLSNWSSVYFYVSLGWRGKRLKGDKGRNSKGIFSPWRFCQGSWTCGDLSRLLEGGLQRSLEVSSLPGSSNSGFKYAVGTGYTKMHNTWLCPGELKIQQGM